MLLFALCWLTLPAVFAPVERALVGAACLLPRVWSSICGAPAQAAEPDVQRRLASLGDALAARLRDHDVRSTASPWPGAEAVHCAVLSVEKRPGGGNRPCELRLDHTYRELAGCSEIVTKGDALIGFLLQPGTGPAADDTPGDPARIVLLNSPAARPLHAMIATPDGGSLRFVVRAAATADPAPLAVDLWDDPYRAARLDRAGLPVTTRAVDGAAAAVPAGLVIGATRIWGYARDADGDALTLGVFVEPVVQPRALSHVVLWRDPDAITVANDEPRAPRRQRGVAYSLPGVGHGRHLLVGASGIPADAAVVLDGYLLGCARGLSFGTSLVTSFAASRQRWSLILLPDDVATAPRELEADVLHADGDRVWLRACDGDALERFHAGHLFTGRNGPCCPPGLWIGRAMPSPREPSVLQVTVPVAAGPCAVEVITDGGVP
jgi:hypothetical protein